MKLTQSDKKRWYQYNLLIFDIMKIKLFLGNFSEKINLFLSL